jgi:predicted nucleotidyltransferase component of viral defense system
MYNFSKQKEMFDVAFQLLEENNLKEVSSLGGGTALAAYYWNHRYSTDIDIFIYDKENRTHLLKPSNWSQEIKSKMNSIGYDDNFRHNDIYTEIVIDENSKIQFFDVIKKSYNPYLKVLLWNREVIIDSIEEIIAKKIYYRGDVGNARDLFDIAIAIHKEPDIFTRMILSKDKIKILYETVLNINNSEELKNLYLAEIILMNPNPEYQILANNTISYLTLFLENIVASYDIGYELSSEEYIFIENEIWVYK